ncbi:kinase-like protein [Lentinula edodes]|nr:kinase-like protein [Lentinula edodes]
MLSPKHKAQHTFPAYKVNSPRTPAIDYNLNSSFHSHHFPPDHQLNPHFVRIYQLGDELGSGGYGFVVTAKHRIEGHEVAVKFIIKEKVPDYAWVNDERYGRLPTEVIILSNIEHDNIVKCLDIFEDAKYYYLVQELHGTPWHNPDHDKKLTVAENVQPTEPLSVPPLSPSVSADSISSLSPSTPSHTSSVIASHDSKHKPKAPRPPKFPRRPSHDLFECIEQSDNKCLSEDQARHVFAQIVDAVDYLDSIGVAHRDIKDENIVIDGNLKVKLIDFGSATFTDPAAEPRPFYNLFYGTTAYAASEILQKKVYQAAPAEVWTLGVLLSYLLTGTSPFPTAKDAVAGRIVLANGPRVSRQALNLMHVCLDPNPTTRVTIQEVKSHPWLKSRCK